MVSYFFFFNDTATTEIYTLSLHDALPILPSSSPFHVGSLAMRAVTWVSDKTKTRSKNSSSGVTRCSCSSWAPVRSEEHTSELQSRQYLVCRLLLEKKITRAHLTCRNLQQT